MKKDYSDMLTLPHHTSSKHVRMSLSDRAAQFAPFAALTGYHDQVAEAARITDQKVSLSEEELLQINDDLLYLKEHIQDNIPIRISYFSADLRKEGGAYQEVTDFIVKLDDINNRITLSNGQTISIDDIRHIDIV